MTDMQTIILDRDDFNSPLHPFLFNELCEQFGLDYRTTNSLELTVAKAVDADVPRPIEDIDAFIRGAKLTGPHRA